MDFNFNFKYGSHHSEVWFYLVTQPKPHYVSHIFTAIIMIWNFFWSHFPDYVFFLVMGRALKSQARAGLKL